MSVRDLLESAVQRGVEIRVHTDDEVAVVRVLRVDDECLLYAPVSSSRPERYAVCDSAGFELPLAAVRRVTEVRARARGGR